MRKEVIIKVDNDKDHITTHGLTIKEAIGLLGMAKYALMQRLSYKAEKVNSEQEVHECDATKFNSNSNA